MKTVKQLVVLALAVLAAGALWAARLLVCARCGHEAAESATTCAYCGGALPLPAPPPDNPLPSAPSADAISTTAVEIVRADLRQAAACRAERPELALGYYENAVAVGLLVRREGVALDAGKTLAAGVEQCRAALTQATRTCPACGGTGKRNISFHSLSGDDIVRTAEGLACPACAGTGSVRGGRSADELRVLVAQGRRDFETRQRAAGRVACGRAWMPAELAAVLDVRQQALVRTALATPCPGCMGLGVQDCGKCKGAARIKCNNGCRDGWIVRKESNSLSPKAALQRRDRCPVCNGTGFMLCPDCQGGGTSACRLCNGTGRNPVCRDCGGQGWGACTKCRGTGKEASGAVCSDCLGKGERLCPKCHGEGCMGK